MDAVSQIADYLRLCAGQLKEFWGFELSRLPSVRLADRTQEDFTTWTFNVNPAEEQASSQRLAELSHQQYEAAKLHFYGHATNHFFAHILNPQMEDCSFPRMPDEDAEHIATVESVVSAATLWLLDRKGYRGKYVVKSYFTYWEETLKQNGYNPEPARLAPGVYYTLKKMDLPDFKKFVQGYQMDSTTFCQKRS